MYRGPLDDLHGHDAFVVVESQLDLPQIDVTVQNQFLGVDGVIMLVPPPGRARSGAEVFDTLDTNGIPCELCDDDFGRRIFDDAEMDAHELVVHQQHPKLGSFEHFGKTIHFSDTPGRIWGPPPVCGQHTREVMHEHGFEDAEIDKLVEAKAVFEEHWVE